MLLNSGATANDSTFGGGASDLVPIEEQRIRMASEDILIEYRERWHVTAKYVFENLVDSEVEALIGFPEYRCLDEYQDCYNSAFQDLRTVVGGKAVVHRKGQLEKSHDWVPFLGQVWLYDVAFPRKSTLNIEHTYSVAAGSDVSENQSITYVTRTGAKWAGSIGHARFTFRLPATAHTVNVPQGIALKSIATFDAEGPEPYVQVVMEQRDWNPQDDLWLSFNSSHHFVFERGSTEALERSGLSRQDICPPPWERETLTPEQEQMCVNDQHALRGYPFKKKSLHAYYYGGSAEWRSEATPWSRDEIWYVRDLQQFPGKPEWSSPKAHVDEPPSLALVPSSKATPAESHQSEAVHIQPRAAPPPANPSSRGCSLGSGSSRRVPWVLVGILGVAFSLRRRYPPGGRHSRPG